MKTTTRSILFATAIALACAPGAARAATIGWVPTNAGGADVEIKEEDPFGLINGQRGSNVEIASRIIDTTPTATNDRNSLIYLKFDIGGAAVPGTGTALKLTYRNTNLNGSRIQDTVTPNPAFRTGLQIYGLHVNDPGNNWTEGGLLYSNAPGLKTYEFDPINFPGTFISGDGNIGTQDFKISTDSNLLNPADNPSVAQQGLRLLGTVLFPNIGNQNHLPVGGELIFQSALLNQFIQGALNEGKTSVTLVAGVLHAGTAPIPQWLNFNYLFNPKEQVNLNTDVYDNDTTDMIPGVTNFPAGNMANATGLYSPSLLLEIPEPASMAMLALAACGFTARRRK